jgi:hypothetical protein
MNSITDGSRTRSPLIQENDSFEARKSVFWVNFPGKQTAGGSEDVRYAEGDRERGVWLVMGVLMYVCI